ncbi:hypothetical protein V1506DRAFT_524656 [Lipomyces tetrasporus]
MTLRELPSSIVSELPFLCRKWWKGLCGRLDIKGEEKSTWRYYDRGVDTWSNTEPLPTARRQSAAIISLPSGKYSVDSDSVICSAYHNPYLLFFLTGDHINLRVKYASTRIGPWSTDDKILYTLPAQVQSGLVTPVTCQTGTQIAGQAIFLSSIEWNRFVTRVSKLSFILFRIEPMYTKAGAAAHNLSAISPRVSVSPSFPGGNASRSRRSPSLTTLKIATSEIPASVIALVNPLAL